MSFLTDVDIKKFLGRDIVIEPFKPGSLTPIGYDFNVGDFVFTLESGLLKPDNGYYLLPPKETVQILTKESLWVSSRIAGTFHSKVSLASKGLSHISTTLDPGWYGPLLITVRNNTKDNFPLEPGTPFVTLVFSRVLSPTKSPCVKPAFRRDILEPQMKTGTEEYIKKVSFMLNDDATLAVFKEKVENANKPMFRKMRASGKSWGLRKFLDITLTLTISAAIIALIFLNTYWNKIRPFFNNIEYDSKIFAVQITAILAIVSLLVSLKKK